jgi:hypothetical protein
MMQHRAIRAQHMLQGQDDDDDDDDDRAKGFVAVSMNTT